MAAYPEPEDYDGDYGDVRSLVRPPFSPPEVHLIIGMNPTSPDARPIWHNTDGILRLFMARFEVDKEAEDYTVSIRDPPEPGYSHYRAEERVLSGVFYPGDGLKDMKEGVVSALATMDMPHARKEWVRAVSACDIRKGHCAIFDKIYIDCGMEGLVRWGIFDDEESMEQLPLLFELMRPGTGILYLAGFEAYNASGVANPILLTEEDAAELEGNGKMIKLLPHERQRGLIYGNTNTHTFDRNTGQAIRLTSYVDPKLPDILRQRDGIIEWAHDYRPVTRLMFYDNWGTIIDVTHVESRLDRTTSTSESHREFKEYPNINLFDRTDLHEGRRSMLTNPLHPLSPVTHFRYAQLELLHWEKLL